MKQKSLSPIKSFLPLISLIGVSFLLQSCARTGDDVWEDTKSAGRHMQRGIRTLGGKQGDSRQIRSRNDFEVVKDDGCYYLDDPFSGYDYEETMAPKDEFIPLGDPSHELITGDMMSPPPRETPGEFGSSIPGIEAFRDPSVIPEWTGIFQPIYFDYDSSLVKGERNLQIIHGIANFLCSHPRVLMFIEGHTDERGPQAYNLALGSRRGHAVRHLLIGEGISPDRLFTISYGKERPVVLEHHEEGWSKNRRAEFKIYE